VKICIVRHGSAVAGTVNDQNRSLTEKGTMQTEMAGKWLQTQTLTDPLCWHSPFLRTRQTAGNIILAGDYTSEEHSELTPDGSINALVDDLQKLQRDVILVSHLPLVGHLASYLVDGEIRDQPWSPAECWLLEGDIAGPGCMTVISVWYPALVKV